MITDVAGVLHMHAVAEGLMQDIISNPADDVPRLVLADWLEEQGEGVSGGAPAGAGRESSSRAEFIRVQVALAAHPEIKDCTDLSAAWCPVCGDCPCDREESMDDPACPLHRPGSLHGEHDALRRRARELFDRFGLAPERSDQFDVPRWLYVSDASPEEDPGDWPTGVGGWEGLAIVRRGFVAEITCTLATWYGGPCGRCQGRRDGREYPSSCRACRGKGTLPGHGPALVRACPLQAVTLSDHRPGPVIRLPDDVVRHLPPHPESAADAISTALLAWARGRSESLQEPPS